MPVPGRALDGPDALGRAAGWFPLVGLALGGVLWVEDRVLAGLFREELSTLLIVGTWKLLTGGIHLDGLADSLDGLTGRDSSERLAIMRDARIGAFGALGLLFLVLLSYVALTDLTGSLGPRALVVAPAVGRLAPLLLARTLSPATPGEGLGAAFMNAVSGRTVGVGLGIVAVASGLILGPWGFLSAAVGLVLAWGVAGRFSRRLGGLTGDGLGAGVELAELGVLLSLASLRHLRLA